MADFVAPQFQNPDFLRQAALGQSMGTQRALAPGAYQAQQQGLEENALNLQKLRQTIMQQSLYQQIAQGLTHADPNALPNGGQSTQTGQGGATAPDASTYGASSPMGGMNPGTLQALALLRGDDPLKTAEGIQGYQQKQRQLQVAGPMSLAETVANDANADQIVRNNPSLQQQWVAMAPKLGLDPYKDLTPDNARRVAAFGYNNLAASAGLAPKEFGFTGGLKPGEAQYQNGRLVAGNPDGLTPDQKANLELSGQRVDIERQRLGLEKSRYSSFTPDEGALMAALAERGVSLPSGFRSQQQQKQLYQGLIDRNPGQSPDQIADLIKGGKIDLAGQMRETATAGNIAGKVKYAENELSQSIPLALEASKSVPRGQFMPLNKLLQTADTAISDPALLNLKIKTQSVLNAYDMLAARGGTDVGKRAEQHALLSSAQSPEAFQAALNAFQQEAQVSHKAADLSMGRGDSGSAPASAVAHLKAHPELSEAFKAKYGYLPK